MNRIFLYMMLALSLAGGVFAQPHDRIRFSYERHTNIYIDEEGVFADTLFFKFNLAGIDFILRPDPLHPGKTVGFKSLESLEADEKRFIAGLMYHTNESLVAVFDGRKNVTTISVSRTSRGQEVFYKNLKQAFPGRFKYTITIDYNRGTIEYDFPQTSRGKDGQADTYAITYTSDDQTKGNYTKNYDGFRVVNLVELDPALDPKIVATDVFSNNAFGMRKTVSVDDILELTSFTYQ